MNHQIKGHMDCMAEDIHQNPPHDQVMADYIQHQKGVEFMTLIIDYSHSSGIIHFFYHNSPPC